MAKIIKEIVSEAILSRLSDPRLTTVVSVTEVKLTPDGRKADIYLSILSFDAKEKKNSFEAVKHARGHIQTMLAHELNIRFCPIIEFHIDDKVHKACETLRLIDEVAKEFKDKPEPEEIQEGQNNREDNEI